ncbi:hypothetical protein GIB67_020760 [Kingdonia uniflora]|uniref:Uncharacterized protein n=1 Tax=Kingdonia uniflora TaxID=39325 RepID=A0A7J7M720_9MAGN|nr:hypothetical protein GIB67_020760 [Kingdonia uniflora]
MSFERTHVLPGILAQESISFERAWSCSNEIRLGNYRSCSNELVYRSNELMYSLDIWPKSQSRSNEI